MFEKVLIANRGAIACRIIRTLRRMGVKSVAVYTEADALSRHVIEADEAYCIGSGVAAESYLRAEKILEVATHAGANAIHPGYGFLSEKAEFAEQCADHGISFIGPTPHQMRAFGLKHTARELAQQNQVPLLPGTGLLKDLEDALRQAAHIGYPVMLKSTAGGGGIGMRLCWNREELSGNYESVKYLAQNNFKDAGLFLEKYVEKARHIEVQIFGDGKGGVIALGERDCSMQRRNQKVIEETPAAALPPRVRQALLEAAVRLGQSVNYQSAGTVEYIFDASTAEFYFLEVNTRLQVEHGITEEVTGIDLVEWMVRQAAGDLPPLDSFDIHPHGASIQVRVYAENAVKDFQPSCGILTEAEFPSSSAARVETWVERGVDVTPFYDPMLAKIIVYAPDREQAIARLLEALDVTALHGVETNVGYLRQILRSEAFRSGQHTTSFLNSFRYIAHTIDILSPGVQTTVQDYPGRTGYWSIGVPPSGPMDGLAFRLANRLVNNSENAENKAGLEITLSGPVLRFNCDSVIAVCGAPMEVRLDGEPLAYWRAHRVKAGSLLQFGKLANHGCRAYLAVQGGIRVPDYLDSKSTFTLGHFGGHAGRTLLTGDVLHIFEARKDGDGGFEQELPEEWVPRYTGSWEIGVLYGPHGAPDFFTGEDIETLFATDWEVHYNSNRTGVRLIGPKPHWARSDGGEAGLHPSNIHDNAYAVGTVDFTGDMPVILGPDGPSLGGFVCPVTIIQAELWKMGQLKPGDRVRFRRMSMEQALALELQQDAGIKDLRLPQNVSSGAEQGATAESTPVLHFIPQSDGQVQVVYRQAGDKNLLVEYGPLELDLNLRFRAHALMDWVQAACDDGELEGILDLTPGIRSLQVHFDSRILPRDKLLEMLAAAEKKLPDIDDMEVPARIVHLPLSWDDAATRLAIEKYMQSVRSDAPWCPSNIEFIRRINGLDGIEEVQHIVFSANYLVMGLGDVYLGAPVATPVDPRHRLVTTKYNPARTWTPENAVGIGGAYLCIYGMEGPGGYQFVGRTVQMWNRYRQTADFKEGKPWLLRFFDQIRFYPVSEGELLKLRRDFITGHFKLKIEETTFSLKQYNAFLKENAASISAFKARQQAAFEAERERWKAEGKAEYISETMVEEADTQGELDLPSGSQAVGAHVTGTVWKLLVKEGQRVEMGNPVVVVESMKMEFSVEAPVSGTIRQLFCKEGSHVSAGQMLLIIQEE
ncbi:MAG: urea carboxylase [Nitrosospira multiformis]|nr:urea carboxylase [Nitrosospira multiformis]